MCASRCSNSSRLCPRWVFKASNSAKTDTGVTLSFYTPYATVRQRWASAPLRPADRQCSAGTARRTQGRCRHDDSALLYKGGMFATSRLLRAAPFVWWVSPRPCGSGNRRSTAPVACRGAGTNSLIPLAPLYPPVIGKLSYTGKVAPPGGDKIAEEAYSRQGRVGECTGRSPGAVLPLGGYCPARVWWRASRCARLAASARSCPAATLPSWRRAGTLRGE